MAEVQPTHLSVHLLRLPTRSSLAAAHGVRSETFRMLTVVGLHVDNDLGMVAGWGECSALNEPGYTSEWAEGAFDVLRSGRPIDATRFPMAAAAVEMACLDAELRASKESLADRLGTTGKSTVAGAVVGLAPLPTMLDEIEQLVDGGYRRVKLKIAPGRVTVPVAAIRQSFPELELHVDANGSLRSLDLPALVELRDLGVRVIEQPFAPGDHGPAARLVAESDVAVVADESVRTFDDIDVLALHRAATGIVVKPSKLGGIRAALQVLDRAAPAGMEVSLGGMLESGLGRHVLAALAPLEAFTLIGDVSPARRWLAADPFPDISLRNGTVRAPARHGIAGRPDRDALSRYTVRYALVATDQMIPSGHSASTELR